MMMVSMRSALFYFHLEVGISSLLIISHRVSHVFGSELLDSELHPNYCRYVETSGTSQLLWCIERVRHIAALSLSLWSSGT